MKEVVLLLPQSAITAVLCVEFVSIESCHCAVLLNMGLCYLWERAAEARLSYQQWLQILSVDNSVAMNHIYIRDSLYASILLYTHASTLLYASLRLYTPL